MSAREAMGLEGCYQHGVLEGPFSQMNKMKCKSSVHLLKVIDSIQATLSERWCAGTLLALMGDPRINLLNPLMVDVPAAKVLCGSTLDEIRIAYEKYKRFGVKYDWLLKEYPKHEIHLLSYRIAKYPVTNYEYLQFLLETKHTDIPNSWLLGIYDALKANHPVYGIADESADAYALWLSRKTNRNFRLPSEYEWEYAACGPERKEFPWGESFIIEGANTVESGIYCTTPIGIFPRGASYFGCLDMSGNVEEYVANTYFTYPNGRPISDDLGGENDYRVTRGGSFTRYADLARCRRRHGYYKNEVYVFGFRLAEDLRT